jgi:hypothetical protein
LFSYLFIDINFTKLEILNVLSIFNPKVATKHMGWIRDLNPGSGKIYSDTGFWGRNSIKIPDPVSHSNTGPGITFLNPNPILFGSDLDLVGSIFS